MIWMQGELDFWLDRFLVPDAPRNLQLSLNNEEEGVIIGHWAPPIHTHGLIREYIVSTVQTLGVRELEFPGALCPQEVIWCCG